MLTTNPHLRTRRPSPTTVEYTVSTSPALTLPLRLLILLTFILRLLIALLILQLLYAKYQLYSYAAPHARAPSCLPPRYARNICEALTHTRLGALASLLAARTPLTVLLPVAGSLLYLLSLRLHTTESLLVLRGLGIQTSSSSATYLSSSDTRFIPTEKIQDVLVNEAFRGFEVRYYLVVVVEGEESVVVVFPRLLPRRDVVERVWRGCRACLFEGTREMEREKRDVDGHDGGGGGVM